MDWTSESAYKSEADFGVRWLIQSPPKESKHLRQSQVLKIEGVEEK